MIDYDYKLIRYYNNIFDDIKENINDYDTLKIGIEIIKIATSRLDGDLNNKEILKEYNKLINIINKLEEIKNNYV